MPVSNARGHLVPTESEAPSRAGWVLNPLLSVNDVVPVANATSQAAALTAIGATTARPLIVFRIDTGTLEYSTGGAWAPVGPGPWTDVVRSTAYDAGVTATTFTTLPGMSVTVTVPAGRKVRAEARFPYAEVPDGGGVQLQLTFNGVVRDGFYVSPVGAVVSAPAALRDESTTSGSVAIVVQALKIGVGTPALRAGGVGPVVFRWQIV